MKIVFCFFFTLSSFAALAQKHRPVICFDQRVGLGYYNCGAQKIADKMNSVGPQGSRKYPYFTAEGYEKSTTPYLNLACGIRFTNFFELSVGGSYSTFKYDLMYENIANNYSTYAVYDRTVSISNTKVVNHDFRLELTPVFRIFNTKIAIGLFNFDFVKSNLAWKDGTTNEYKVISKHNTGNSYSNPADSIVTQTSSTDFSPDIAIGSTTFLTVSIGVEQEIPIRKLRYFVGAKCIYSRNVSNLSLVGYIGIRISKQYSWKNPIN